MPAEVVADMLADRASCYRVVSSRDARWDGRLYLGVVSTGVYCRPSCPARTPLERNCRYYASSSAAVAAGFRACRRCRPDALPGSREHDVRADLAARALRLIRDGAVDDTGVAGLASRLHVSERHLHRVLLAEVGAGPLRLASSRRAQTARLLIEQSDLSMSDVAFAAGFASVRQFNDVMRAEFGCAPSRLRGRVADGDRRPARRATGLALRLRYREPYALDAVWGYLGARLIPGVERLDDTTIVRQMRTTAGPAEVAVEPPAHGCVRVRLALPELDSLGSTVAAVRRWLDLDADPVAVDTALSADPSLAGLVHAQPGMRVPGSVDGFELAVRAVVGQQVSVAGARTMLGRIAERLGTAGVMPSAGDVADAGPEALAALGLTGRRARTLVALASAVAAGHLVLDAGADRAETRARLIELPGIGPWTAEYVALRAFGDPDAWPGTDLVLARRVSAAGLDPTRWRPWRGYAAMHLWTAQSPLPSTTKETS
jgi:AraC family transcriptional regulator of adaptative response / DNA-3-methyladenine glycosylase II